MRACYNPSLVQIQPSLGVRSLCKEIDCFYGSDKATLYRSSGLF